MRLKVVLTCALFALAGMFYAPTASQAGHGYRHAPSGWGQTRTVRHHVYYPRYKHVYRVHHVTDPYTYRSEHRGYYPYYNSGYWRPSHEVRRKRVRYYHRKPRYHQAWGANKRLHRSREWHRRHYRQHRHW